MRKYRGQDELDAMVMVGATSLFIKLPFLVEGALQGVLGGLTALGLSFLVFEVVLQKSLGSLLLITGIDTIHFLPVLWQIMLILGGGVIGLLDFGRIGRIGRIGYSTIIGRIGCIRPIRPIRLI